MTPDLTPDERSWLKSLYEEELDTPLPDDLDEEDEHLVLIPATAVRAAGATLASLKQRGLIVDGPQYLELTPAGRALAQESLS